MMVYVFVIAATLIVSRAAEARFSGAANRVMVPRQATVAALVCAAIPAGVSALRWRVGTDYWTYDSLFDQYVEEFRSGLRLEGEPGMRVIAGISDALGGDSAAMFALASILTVVPIVLTLWRWSPSFSFSIGIFLLAGSWLGSFNGVRQYLACAVIFVGHRAIIERRLGKWLLFVAVASLFHSSALFGLLLYFVPQRKLSLMKQLVLIGAAMVTLYASGLLIPWLGEVESSERWTSSYAGEELHPLRVALAFVPILLYWVMPNPKSIEVNRAWFYVNMLLLLAAGMLATSTSALLARFLFYIQIFLPLGLAYVTLLPRRIDQFIIRAALIVLYAVFMYFEVNAAANLQEFQWIFDRDG